MIFLIFQLSFKSSNKLDVKTKYGMSLILFVRTLINITAKKYSMARGEHLTNMCNTGFHFPHFKRTHNVKQT